MSSKETAEAILFVIRRILKWALFLIIGLVIIGVIIYGFTKLYDWYSFGRHKDKVQVAAFFDATKCDKENQVFIGVVNDSSKTLESASFFIKVTKKGFSTQINYDQRYTYDKILSPSEGWGGCIMAVDKDYRKPFSIKDMEVVVTNFYPVFKDK